MEFSSLTFIFLFLPIFIISFFVFSSHKKIIILLFSLFFYVLSSIHYFYLLIFIIIISYIFAKLVKRQNGKVYYSLFFILLIGFLFFFKYHNLIYELISDYLTSYNFIYLALPFGMSYYIFEAISYVNDCYKGRCEPHKLIDVACYLSFFPTIGTGPIHRFNNFNKYFNSKDKASFDNLAEGLRRFIIGLSKKIIVADNLSRIVTVAFSTSINLDFSISWIGILAFTMQLYYDFSGYSDMAIGISQMIGYKLQENFNSPFSSKSIKEFWNRWHISLGTWFRDYIYIPLGGNRVSFIRWMINVMVVWIFTGIWHGSTVNYFIWGIFLGVSMIIEKVIRNHIKINGFIGLIYTNLIFMMSMVLFKCQNTTEIINYFTSLFSFSMPDINYIKMLDIVFYMPFLFISILMQFQYVKEKILLFKNKFKYVYDIALVILLILSLFFIISGSNVAPLYSEF